MFFRRKHINAGMTLAETLIALSIFVAIMVAVSTFQANVFSYQRSVSSSLETAQNAQVLLKVIMKELRSMAPGGNGAYPLTSAATSSITFFSDINGDGIVEQVTYTLLGNTIYKAVIKPSGSPAIYNFASQATTTLVTNVRNSFATPVFQYYDGNFDGTTAALSQPISVTMVQLINVTLTLDIDPNRSPLPISYSAKVELRNLKTNL